MTRRLPIIGYASGIAANNIRCAEGPLQLQQSSLFQRLDAQGIATFWHAILYSVPNQQRLAALSAIAEINLRLAKLIDALVNAHSPFLVLGGDHTSAIGAWSGAAYALAKPLGLIWIDAHMDSHTPETSISKNIHGMPLACLLGYGDKALTEILTSQPKVLPQHISLIGVRSFEAGEAKLLQRLRVRIYAMDEIKRRGLTVIFQEALARAKSGTAGFGISLDLDAINPEDAPGVSAPEPDGVSGKEMAEVLAGIACDSKFIGLEIAEYNPSRDLGQKTFNLIQDLVLSAFKQGEDR